MLDDGVENGTVDSQNWVTGKDKDTVDSWSWLIFTKEKIKIK